MTLEQDHTVQQPDPALLVWTVHPARERPRAALAAACFLMLATAALQLGLRTPWMTVLGAALMVGAVGDFLFPSTYHITARQVERRGLSPRRLAWADVRAAYLADDGIHLSPLAERGPATAWRGVFVRWRPDGEPGRDAVLALVDHYATQRHRPGLAPEGQTPEEPSCASS